MSDATPFHPGLIIGQRYALVAPIVVIMLVVIAYPLLNAVWTSLRDQRLIGSDSDFVAFETAAYNAFVHA